MGITGVVYDFSEPYWRIHYPDGDWEELKEREVTRGKEKALLYESEFIHGKKNALYASSSASCR